MSAEFSRRMARVVNSPYFYEQVPERSEELFTLQRELRTAQDVHDLSPKSRVVVTRAESHGRQKKSTDAALANFNPNQPRQPAGIPEGGEWVENASSPTGYHHRDTGQVGRPGDVVAPRQPLVPTATAPTPRPVLVPRPVQPATPKAPAPAQPAAPTPPSTPNSGPAFDARKAAVAQATSDAVSKTGETPPTTFEGKQQAVQQAADKALGKAPATSHDPLQAAHDAAKAKMDDAVERHVAASRKQSEAWNAYDDAQGDERNRLRQPMWDASKEERELEQERKTAEKEYAAAASALAVSSTNQAMAESAARGSNLSVDRAMRAADDQGVDDSTKVKYRRAFSHIAAQMPEEATRMLNMGLQGGFKFYGHIDDVTREVDKLEGGDSFAEGLRTHGFFNPLDGSLNLDGDSALPPESVIMSQAEAMRGVFAHEMTHAIDYGARAKTGETYSDDPEWGKVHAAEASALSDYATTLRVESFAEFGRLVYGSDVDRETIKSQFPLGYAFFKKRGLINW